MSDKHTNLSKLSFEQQRLWLLDSNNVYVGNTKRLETLLKNGLENEYKDPYKTLAYLPGKFKWSFCCPTYKTHNFDCLDFDCITQYIKNLIITGLLYRIDELRTKNLGCYCYDHDIKKDHNNTVCYAIILRKIMDEPCYSIYSSKISKMQNIQLKIDQIQFLDSKVQDQGNKFRYHRFIDNGEDLFNQNTDQNTDQVEQKKIYINPKVKEYLFEFDREKQIIPQKKYINRRLAEIPM